MRRLTLLGIALLGLCAQTQSSFAADAPVSRRDGFLILWEAIRRPAVESKEKPYADVPKGSRGFLEITYAKTRGLLGDVSHFHPDDALQLSDALVWMLRTRNVADPDELTTATLPVWLKRYPLGDFVDPTKGENGTIHDRALTEAELRALQVSFDEQLKKETHEVSLYAEKFHGKGTAAGEPFDMHAMTAAHRTYPFNTLVRVTNIANGKSVVVRINDRGPYVHGRDMDLSLAAFTAIESRSKGKFRATFERLGDSTVIVVDDHDTHSEPDDLVAAAGTSDTAKKSAKPCVAIGEQTRIGRVRLTSGVPQVLPLGKNVVLTSTEAFSVRSVTAPDGTKTMLHRWILPGEQHELLPSDAGTYIFNLGAKNGRGRQMEMNVVQCGE